MVEKEFSGNDESEIIKLNKRLKKWRIASYFSIILFMSAVLAVSIYLFYPNLFSNLFSKINVKLDDGGEEACPGCVRRFIDGVYVESGRENLYPIAVVIDNHVDARPAFGLSQANLVYEAEAEGRITRYLAIFSEGKKLEKIGPIRSARPYFIDLVRELSALFVHCGGSPEALVKIVQENIFDLNEFYKGSYFWRVEDRGAPYNIFTSADNLNNYLEEKKANEVKFLSWEFKDEDITGIITKNKEIEIDFKNSDFLVKWEYDIINNEYLRFLSGDIHQDGDGKEIRAKNIIIQYIEAEVIDEELRLKMKTSGSGPAIVCLDGQCREAEWRKKNSASRTRYYYENGDDQFEEVKFNAGKIWVEIVRPEQKIKY